MVGTRHSTDDFAGAGDPPCNERNELSSVCPNRPLITIRVLPSSRLAIIRHIWTRKSPLSYGINPLPPATHKKSPDLGSPEGPEAGAPLW